MPGVYTNRFQAALLFDHQTEFSPVAHIEAIRAAVQPDGVALKLVQQGPQFAILMGPGELMIHVTAFNGPADPAIFEGSLRSPLTAILSDDMAQRVARHRSHVLVDIYHGLLDGIADDPAASQLLDSIGLPRRGRTFAAFNQRIATLGSLVTALLDIEPASAVHWTQSNMLLPGERAATIIATGTPSLLTVHPNLFGSGPSDSPDHPATGFCTLGAADYVGREILVEAAPVPWYFLYEQALAFIRIAIKTNGYIVPDNKILQPVSDEYAVRVRHLDPEADVNPTGRPLFGLTLLYSRKHGYAMSGNISQMPVAGCVAAAREAPHAKVKSLACRPVADGGLHAAASARHRANANQDAAHPVPVISNRRRLH